MVSCCASTRPSWSRSPIAPRGAVPCVVSARVCVCGGMAPSYPRWAATGTRMSRATRTGPPPTRRTRGDAQHLSFRDDSFDAALVLGPLYHLTERSRRVRTLRETHRVVRSGGIVAAAAISRFASLFDGLVRKFWFDPDFRAVVERDLDH